MRMAMVLTTLGLLASGTAASQSVTYDFDKSADFSRLKRYAWVRGTPVPDQLNHNRIIAAIDAQLARRGLVKVEGGDSDILVAYHASFDRDREITGYAFGHGRLGWGGTRTATARVTEITTGTVLVDVIGAESRSIIWRGTATKEIDLNADPAKRERNINGAMAKLFRHFPPSQ